MKLAERMTWPSELSDEGSSPRPSTLPADTSSTHPLTPLHLTMTPPISPKELLSRLPSLLPPTDPKLASPGAALAALLHTLHVVLGFRFAASSAYTNYEVLSEGWWAENNTWAGEYRHDRSGMKWLVRVGVLGGRGMVDVLAVEVRAHASSSTLHPRQCLSIIL